MSAAQTLLRPAFALVWLYSMVTTLAWAALLPVLPLFVQEPLRGGDVAVGVVVSGALLGAAVAQPFLGRLADRRGRRVLLVGGPLVFAVCVISFQFADSPTTLFLLRGAAAIGDAAFVVGAITVVNDLAPEARRGEAYSIYSLSSWAGVGLGPVLGELVLHTYSYDAVWLLVGGLALGGAIVARFLPETRPAVAPVARAPLWNAAALRPGLLLAFEQVGFAALIVFTPLFARDLGMHGAGLVLLVNAAVLVTVRTFGRKIPDRLGPGRTAAAGLVFASLGLWVGALAASPAGLYCAAAGFGLGHALLYPAVFMLAVGGAPAHGRSAALGTLKACEATGFAAGALLLGVVAAHADYAASFVVAGVATGLGLVPLCLSPVRRLRRERAQT